MQRRWRSLRVLRSLSGALLALSAAASAQAAPIAREHLTVELVAERGALVPGTRQWLGVRLVHDEHWHTYWTNPGDSGLPTRLAWRLPDGYAADAIAWPAPHRMVVGDLHNFGYDGEMLLPVALTVPATARAGDEARIEVDADWLVCKEECIPDEATLSLTLPVAAAAEVDPRWQPLFAAALSAQPQVTRWTAAATALGDDIEIRIEGDDLPAAAALDAFAVQPQLLANGAVAIARDGDALTIGARRNEYFANAPEAFDLVLVSRDDARAWTTRVTWREAGGESVAAANPSADSSPPAAITGIAPEVGSLAKALLLAFLGGLLLNLMPCVFPVLSLKALGIAESAHAPAAARREGLAYFAGAVGAFVILALVLIALRAAGQSLGWGFQLQSPVVVALLAYLMIGLGLSMSGVYVFGARLGGVGQSLTEGQGTRAAFFTGVLACVVASPCTAPAMAPALGYALTQPAPAAVAVFAALGSGLALPILVLGWMPALTRLLPRPGAWMDTLKQFLAWPLYLTAVWLLWVLMRQVGADATALVLAGIVGLIAALVWHGRAQYRERSWPRHAAIALLFALSLSPLLDLSVPAPGAQAAPGSAWQSWSAERVALARAEGRPVLVNMTAAWCITCLANERVALSSEAFRAQLKDAGIAYLKGDWTQRDAAITAYLAEFGRSGVPLYVLYPRGGGAPEVLPQILTPRLVADALSRAAAGTSAPADSRSVP